MLIGYVSLLLFVLSFLLLFPLLFLGYLFLLYVRILRRLACLLSRTERGEGQRTRWQEPNDATLLILNVMTRNVCSFKD